MRVVGKTGYLLSMIGICFVLPQQGRGEFSGGIMVYAWDSKSGVAPPPATIANLDGNDSQSFGSSDLVTFSGYFEAGTHTVEVTTGANGYLLRQCPNDPNAVKDPYSNYGNPRYVVISETTNYVPVSFQFDPVVTVLAVVRDAWTMERLADASIEFIFAGSTGDIAVCKYPATATYASNWVSDAEGRFPTNTILYLHDYDLGIARNGYHPYVENNVVTNALPGDAIDLGTIYLEPIDNNSNQIADAWEASYFGAGYTVITNADADGDGASNRDEYIAGTDPTNSQSYLWVESIPATNGLVLAWPVEPNRTYRVCGTTNLCTNAWVQVGGPWEATNEQVEMVWEETNMDLSWNSNYRVEVVPSWWQGTNQVLINTNRPAGLVGDGNYTNWPGPPPPPGS